MSRILALFVFVAAMLNFIPQADAQSVANKVLCEGRVSDGACDQVTSTPERGDPVFYQFVLYAGATDVLLPVTEDFPANFAFASSSSPVVCNVAAGSGVGGAVPITFVSGSTPLQFTADLKAGQEALCAMEGTFTTAGGTAVNTVSAMGSSDSETTVISANTRLDMDLEIEKELIQPTVTPLNISGGPQRAKYRITVTTDEAVYLGDFFRVYDQLALFPTGVTVNANLVGGSVCRLANSGVLANCVVTSSNSGNVTSPAWKDFASWGITAGTLVLLEPGDALIIEYEVEYSPEPSVGCVRQDDAEGMRNRAFLGLAGSVQALRDDDNGNNDTGGDSDNDLPLVTGVYNVDPDCEATPPPGPGIPPSVLTITKTMILPDPPTKPWGSIVPYVIEIENTSPIVFVRDLEISDTISNLPGTPNFEAQLTEVGLNCASAGCTQIAPAPPTPPAGPVKPLLSYYDSAEMWKATISELRPGERASFILWIKLDQPTCDYAPLIGTKLVRNTATVKHRVEYPMIGNGPTTWISYDYVKSASTDVAMVPPPACPIAVEKTSLPVPNVGADRIVFDEWKRYELTFSSLPTAQATQNIRTLIDAVRIENPYYATGLSVDYDWQCNDLSNGGVRGYQNSGNGTATVNHVGAPHQGVRIMEHPGVVEFDPGASLKCAVRVKVQKPALEDPYCFSDGTARLQNLALMDGSAYFNANMPWPHAQQGTSWDAASDKLPNCFNLVVNKNASPGVVPPNGGPITYTIQVINANQPGTSGDLNFPEGPDGMNTRAIFVDRFTTSEPGSAMPNGTLSYNSGNACQPAGAAPCNINLSNGGTAFTTYSNIPAGGAVTYSYTVTGPYTPHQLCNDIRGEMVKNGATFHKEWYPKDVRTWQSDTCTLVRGSLQVNKRALVPSWINFDATTQFTIEVECDTPSGFNDINRDLAVSNSNQNSVITQIPIGSSCEIEEVDLPDPDQWGDCEWLDPVYVDGRSVTIDGSEDPHQLTVRNQLVCDAGPTLLDIKKELVSPQDCPTINAFCTFKITVTNVGGNPFSGPVELTDVFSNNLTPPGYYYAPNIPAPPAAPWGCTQPTGGNAPVTCSAALLNLTPGQSSSFEITFDMPNSGTNCAILEVPEQDPQPESCVIVGDVPQIDNSDLLIEKETVYGQCPGAAVGSGLCTFRIIITNTGGLQLDGALSFRDVISGGAAGAGSVAVSSVSPVGWTCATINSVTTECFNPSVSIGPNQSITIDLVLNLQYAAPVGTNCADIDQVDAIGRLTKSCSPIQNVVPADAATLTLKKSKVTTENCLLGTQFCTFRFEISNTGTADYTGPISFEDEFSAASGWSSLGIDGISQSGWNCGLAAPIYRCDNTLVQIQQGETYTVDIKFDYGPGFSARLNCARLVQGTAKGPDSCTSIGQMRIQKDLMSAQDCASTGNRHCTFRITLENAWAGMHTGPVTIADAVDFGGVPMNTPVVGSPTNGWTCPVGGGGVGLDCSHPGPVFPSSGVTVFEVTLDLSAVPPIHIGNCAEIAQPQQAERQRSCVQLGAIWEPPLRVRNPNQLGTQKAEILEKAIQGTLERPTKRRGFKLPKVRINIGGIRVGGRKREPDRKEEEPEREPRGEPKAAPKVDAAGNPIGG